MAIPRIIPVLLLSEGTLVKTTKFKKPDYIGDPINTISLFNRLCVDELMVLDIDLPRNNRDDLDWDLLKDISIEAQVPLSYGGGIKSQETARRLIRMGFEKVVLNSHIDSGAQLVREISHELGAQAVVVSIDLKKNFWGKYEIVTEAGSKKRKEDIPAFLQLIQNAGAGEILINFVDSEGTFSGIDKSFIESIKTGIHTPLVVSGGVSSREEIYTLINHFQLSGVGVGSLFVYRDREKSVLINYPTKVEIESNLAIYKDIYSKDLYPLGGKVDTRMVSR